MRVQAASTGAAGSLLSNPLILHHPATGATVQMMPTTQWRSQHGIHPGTAGGSSSSGTAPVGVLPGGPDGDTDFHAIVQQYFRDLNGSEFYNLLTQYADEENGATVNSTSLGSTWTDNCGYTSTPSTMTGPVPGGTDAAPIYQTDIQAEVQKAIKVNHWPDGINNECVVFTGYSAADCFAPTGPASVTPTCGVAGPDPAYCAYHGDYQDAGGNYVLYADVADGAFAANPSSVNLCYSAPIGVSDPAHTVNGKTGAAQPDDRLEAGDSRHQR